MMMSVMCVNDSINHMKTDLTGAARVDVILNPRTDDHVSI